MKYQVAATCTITVLCEVEADSPEEAIEMAETMPMQSFCHYCSKGKPKVEWVTTGELDGTPENITAEVSED